MSTDLIPFTYEDYQVRTILLDGEPWLVAADVCAALALRDTSSALKLVDPEDVRRLRRSDTPQFFGGIAPQVQEITVVNESGVYALIFHSRKPEARKFKRWVTNEVIPQIRKTGTYGPASRFEIPKTHAAALRMAAAQMERADNAEARVAELEPSADAWDTLAKATGDDLSVADAAKILCRDPSIKIGRDRLFTVLREMDWAYRQQIDGRHRAYQQAINTGRLSELPSSHYHPRTGELVLDPPQLRVTVKGLGELHQHLGGTAQLRLDLGGVA